MSLRCGDGVPLAADNKLLSSYAVLGIGLAWFPVLSSELL